MAATRIVCVRAARTAAGTRPMTTDPVTGAGTPDSRPCVSPHRAGRAAPVAGRRFLIHVLRPPGNWNPYCSSLTDSGPEEAAERDE